MTNLTAAHVRGLLDAATKIPLVIEDYGIPEYLEDVPMQFGVTDKPFQAVAYFDVKSDAELFALAPQLAAFYLAAQDVLTDWPKAVADLDVRRGKPDAQAEIAELKAALQFYANTVCHVRKNHSEGDIARNALDKDGGEIARAALGKFK